MKVYYIAYNYHGNGLEMIDGPFGTFSEAQSERDHMIGTNVDDPNLVVVTEHKEVIFT
jgi:hypothetical protein